MKYISTFLVQHLLVARCIDSRSTLKIYFPGMPMFDVWGIVIIPGVLEPGTT
jgi:hypothetical protein